MQTFPSIARRYLPIALGILVCVGLGLYYLETLDSLPFFGDESIWIGRSAGWFLLTEGRFDDPFWDFDAIEPPMLGPYVYGMVASLSGYSAQTISKVYNFGIPFADNLKEGRVPDRILLSRCRMASALCGILACVCGMAIVWRIVGPIGGLAAVALLGLNPHYVRMVQRAMSEGILSMWLLVAWLLSTAFFSALSQGKTRRVWQCAVLLGMAAGLGTMTKLTGVVIFAAVVGVGLLRMGHAIRAGHRGRSSRGWQLAAISAGVAVGIGAMVFLAQSPLTWRNPEVGLRKMATFRRDTVFRQQHVLREYALTGVRDRLETFAARTWRDIGTFSASGIAARLHIRWLDGWVFLGGLLWLLLAPQERRPAGDAEHQVDIGVAWVWIAVLVVPSALLIPLDVDRYYLPGLIASAMVQAVGLGALFRHLCRRLISRSLARGPSRQANHLPSTNEKH